MAYAVSAHKQLKKDIPEDVWPEVAEVLKEIGSVDEPARHPKVGPLAGCSVLNSHRMRVGRWRVTFTIFDNAKRIVFTVGFMERGKEDYKQAVATHERRIRDYEKLAG
jgi:mRNA-degrading endonuclease RelE of RelBE toxin-antitoxin system